MTAVRYETGWTDEAIAGIVAALGRPAEEIGEATPLLGILGADRRIGVTLGDDDFSHVPSFGRPCVLSRS